MLLCRKIPLLHRPGRLLHLHPTSANPPHGRNPRHAWPHERARSTPLSRLKIDQRGSLRVSWPGERSSPPENGRRKFDENRPSSGVLISSTWPRERARPPPLSRNQITERGGSINKKTWPGWRKWRDLRQSEYFTKSQLRLPDIGPLLVKSLCCVGEENPGGAHLYLGRKTFNLAPPSFEEEKTASRPPHPQPGDPSIRDAVPSQSKVGVRRERMLCSRLHFLRTRARVVLSPRPLPHFHPAGVAHRGTETREWPQSSASSGADIMQRTLARRVDLTVRTPPYAMHPFNLFQNPGRILHLPRPASPLPRSTKPIKPQPLPLTTRIPDPATTIASRDRLFHTNTKAPRKMASGSIPSHTPPPVVALARNPSPSTPPADHHLSPPRISSPLLQRNTPCKNELSPRGVPLATSRLVKRLALYRSIELTDLVRPLSFPLQS